MAKLEEGEKMETEKNLKIFSFNLTIEPEKYLHPQGTDLLLKLTLKTDVEEYNDRLILREHHLYSTYELIVQEATRRLKDYISMKLKEV